jgi:hypothetical protein
MLRYPGSYSDMGAVFKTMGRLARLSRKYHDSLLNITHILRYINPDEATNKHQSTGASCAVVQDLPIQSVRMIGPHI